MYVKELDGKQLMNSFLEYILLPTGKAGEKNRMRENKDIIGQADNESIFLSFWYVFR